MPAPRFIALEGPDGVGKTTLADALAERLARAGDPPVRVRDPGGTALGDAIRKALLARRNVAPLAELYLFAAARAQLAEEVIRPALAAGRTVLADRYWLSTVAYQGVLDAVAAAWPPEALRRLARAGLEGAEPTDWLLLDAPAETARARRAGRGDAPDRVEARGASYFERVRARYREEARHLPGRTHPLDASASAAGLADRAWASLTGSRGEAAPLEPPDDGAPTRRVPR